MNRHKVKIVGGRSAPGEIHIISDQYRSIATWHRDKKTKKTEIKCMVEPLPSPMRFLLRLEKPLFPRIFNLITFLLATLPKKERRNVLIFISLMSAMIIFKSLTNFDFSKLISSTANASELSSTIIWIATACIAALVYIFLRTKLGSWHGAEHMAIAAYRHRGSTNISAIAKESPIDSRCGGRLVLPLLLGNFLITPLLVTHQQINPWLALFITFEGILWIDKLRGFYSIPVFAQASTLLQRYITTKRPGERELSTAQLAIEELIKAHNKQ